MGPTALLSFFGNQNKMHFVPIANPVLECPFKKIITSFFGNKSIDLTDAYKNLDSDKRNELLSHLLNVELEPASEIIELVNILSEDLKKRLLSNETLPNELKAHFRNKSFSKILNDQLLNIEGEQISSIFLIDYFKSTFHSPNKNWVDPNELLKEIKTHLQIFREKPFLLNMIRLRIQSDLAAVHTIPKYFVDDFWVNKESALGCLVFFAKHHFYDFYELYYQKKEFSLRELFLIFNPLSNQWVETLLKVCPEINSFSDSLQISYSKNTLAVTILANKVIGFKKEFSSLQEYRYSHLEIIKNYINI